jgi:hypothetical protein
MTGKVANFAQTYYTVKKSPPEGEVVQDTFFFCPE